MNLLWTVDRRPWTLEKPLTSHIADSHISVESTVDRRPSTVDFFVADQCRSFYLMGTLLWTVDRGPWTITPVALLAHFLLLTKEVEVQLRHLKLPDIAVGIEARRKLNMIFHNLDLLPPSCQDMCIQNEFREEISGSWPVFYHHKFFIRMEDGEGWPVAVEISAFYYVSRNPGN